MRLGDIVAWCGKQVIITTEVRVLTKIAAISMVLFLVGAFLYADVCTVIVCMQTQNLFTATIDYGEENRENYKAKSLTDIINYLEKKQWRYENAIPLPLRENSFILIFRK